MPHLSIRARLRLASILAAVGVAVLAGLNLWSVQRSEEALKLMVDEAMKPLLAIQEIDGSLTAIRVRAAGILLDHYPLPGTTLDHLREQRQNIELSWATVAQANARTAEVTDALEKTRAGYPRLIKLLDDLDRAYRAGDKSRVDDMLQADWAQMHKTFAKPLKVLSDTRQTLSDATLVQVHDGNRRDLLVAAVLALVTTLGVVAIMVMTSRSVVGALREVTSRARQIAGGDLSHPFEGTVVRAGDEVGDMMVALSQMQTSLGRLVGSIRESADQIQSATANVADGNHDLNHRTAQAAQSLQQTASAVGQLTETVRAGATSAREANLLASSASEAAERGGAAVQQVVQTMNDIQTSSRRIADIIGVIDGIAFQTNILALNAAVEAARAGEQGRGFAVVASEVRSLAGRSSEAARQIKELISTSVERVESGNALVTSAGDTIKDVVEQVQRVSALIDEVTRSASGQSQEIERVGQGVADLDQATHQNATLVEQSAAVADNLQAQAQRMVAEVSVFRVPAAA